MTTGDEALDIHQRVQEALAGLVLHALDEQDVAPARALIASHVPGCVACTTAMRELEDAAGSLALAAVPRRAPETVWQRIRREIGRPPTRRWIGIAAGVAVVAAAGSLLGWNLTLAGRVVRTEERQAASADVLTMVSHPRSHVVPLALRDDEGPRLALAYVPGRAVLYLFGTMPPPPEGHVYELWLGSGGRFEGVATFVPEGREVLVAVAVDPYRYDSVVITVEPTGGSRQPSQKLAEAEL